MHEHQLRSCRLSLITLGKLRLLGGGQLGHEVRELGLVQRAVLVLVELPHHPLRTGLEPSARAVILLHPTLPLQ